MSKKTKTEPLELFKLLHSRVPAYREFLKDKKIRADKVGRVEDIPVMDKKSYITKYDFYKRFVDGKVPPMAYASSGSSGQPTFWFRSDEQEEWGTGLHEEIFSESFKISKKDPVLAVVCFSMGIWIAGNYTAACLRGMSRRGYNLTTITPGIDKEDIMQILESLSDKFKYLVLAGYPPFINDILHEAKHRGIKLPKQIRVFTSGDSFSEEWRTDMLDIIGQKNSSSIVNIYGSADTGMIGYETASTIALRRKASKNKELKRRLFGDTEKLPALFQCHPYTYLEDFNDEILVTVKSAIPLLRYNIHDLGRVISTKELSQNFKVKSRMPFVTKVGRTDVAVTFYALNIYPEQIRAAIEDKRISKLLTGNYLAYNEYDKVDKREKLIVQFELRDGVTASKDKLKVAQSVLVQYLLKLSSEYRKLTSVIKEKALPEIKLVLAGQEVFKPKGTRGLLQIRGKKARVIL